MNQLKNINIVEKCGDSIQLHYGVEFGSYAKQLNRTSISIFCDQFNSDPWVYEHHYFLTTKYTTNDHIVTLTSLNSPLRVRVRLLDHSIFIEATEHDWIKIEKHLFVLLQKSWRNFMAEHVKGYDEHIKKTIVLANLEGIYQV